MTIDETVKAARRERLCKVAKRFYMNTAAQYSGTEDFRCYMEDPDDLGDNENDEWEVEQWCAVTSSGGEDQWVYLKLFATFEEAQGHATANIDDDIFAEMPVAVVDLDTGATTTPKWSTLQWEAEAN